MWWSNVPTATSTSKSSTARPSSNGVITSSLTVTSWERLLKVSSAEMTGFFVSVMALSMTATFKYPLSDPFNSMVTFSKRSIPLSRRTASS